MAKRGFEPGILVRAGDDVNHWTMVSHKLKISIEIEAAMTSLGCSELIPPI